MACSAQSLDQDFLGRLPAYLVGIVQITPGTVVIFDGTDQTGVPVLASGGVGTVALNSAIACHHGVFIVTSGGAAGSVLLEG